MILCIPTLHRIQFKRRSVRSYGVRGWSGWIHRGLIAGYTAVPAAFVGKLVCRVPGARRTHNDSHRYTGIQRDKNRTRQDVCRPTSREISRKYDRFARWYDWVEGIPDLLGLSRLRRKLLKRASGKFWKLPWERERTCGSKRGARISTTVVLPPGCLTHVSYRVLLRLPR